MSPNSKVSPVIEILGIYLSFDFEWHPETNEITAAGFWDSNDKTQVYLRKDFETCRDFLYAIVGYIVDYETTIGWYTTGTTEFKDGKDSDLRHLHTACVENNVESIVEFTNYHLPSIVGSLHIDLHTVYDKNLVQNGIFHGKLRYTSLDRVSRVLLKEGKYKNLTLSDEDKRNYVLRDAELVIKLSKHDNYKILDIMLAFAEQCNLEFGYVCATNISTWWKHMFRAMLASGECGEPTKVFSHKKFRSNSNGMEELTAQNIEQHNQVIRIGAVLKPVGGIYNKYVIILDAKSLYPSVAIKYNLGFDTINCSCCKEDPACRIPADIQNDCKVESEYWICKLKDSGYKKKLLKFREERFKQKKLGNTAKQEALKTLINGSYGVHANVYFEYYDPRVAELITAYGRKTLFEMRYKAKQMGYQVLYGDTDSIFIYIPIEAENEVDGLPKIKVVIENFQKEFFNIWGIDIETKFIGERFFLSEGKKHYIIYGLDDKEEKKLDTKELFEKENGSLDIAISIARDAMQQLDASKVKPSLLICSEVLGLNPTEYKNQKERVCQVGYVQNLRKGDRAWWYLKEDKPSWTLNESEICQKEYKKFFWHCIEELLEKAGAPVEELAIEFGVSKIKKEKAKRKEREKDGLKAERPRREVGEEKTNLQQGGDR